MSNVMIAQIPEKYGTGASTIIMDIEKYITLVDKPIP